MSKQLLIFAAVFATVHCLGDWKRGFHVKYGYNLLTIGQTTFMSLPQNTTIAATDGWVQRDVAPECLMPNLNLYCRDANLVCIYYDDTGYAAGIQVCVPKNNITSYEFDWSRQGYISWNVTEDSTTTEYWCISAYFISNATLATSASDREANRNSDVFLQDSSIWLTTFNNTLQEISLNSSLLADTLYTKQNCFPWMGTHYYYNMSANTVCSSDTIAPFFILWDNNELIGIAWNAFATLDIDESAFACFEEPTETAVELIVPRGPQCLYDYAKDSMIRTLHIYFINTPELITCL